MIKIIIPEKTPTVNKLYYHRGNMKILTTEARKLRERILKICNKIDQKSFSILKDYQLEIDVEIHEDWFTKNNTVKKKNVLNR